MAVDEWRLLGCSGWGFNDSEKRMLRIHLMILVLFLLSGPGGLVRADIVAFGDSDLGTVLQDIHLLNERGQLEKARSLLEQVTPLIARQSDDLAIEYALIKAHNLGLRGEYHKGVQMLEQLLEQSLSSVAKMRALTLAANIAGVAGLHQQAFDFLREALPLESKVDHPRYTSSLLSNAAVLFALAGELENASELGQRAVDLADLSGSYREQCVARRRFAYNTQFNASPSDQYYALDDAIEHCRKAGDPIFLASLTTQMGGLLRQQGDLALAEVFLDESLTLIEQSNYLAGKPPVALARAQLLRDRGEPDAAFELTIDQLESMRASERWPDLVDAYQLLSEVAYQREDHEQALEFLQARVRAGERQAARDRDRRIAYLQAVFELEQRDREIALLQEQMRVRSLSDQARSQQDHLRQLSVSALVLLLILLVLLLIRARRERHHFRNLTFHDSLTGLLNHTYFFDKASRLVAAQGGERSLCLVLADIDHFKKINDRHGHLEGDQALRRVAARMREAFPPPAIIGRIGGEEFAIALPDCSLDQAKESVDQLRQAINRYRSKSMDSPITMSFGLVSDHHGRDIYSLRELADQALYQAKREGRNRLTVVDNPAPDMLGA